MTLNFPNAPVDGSTYTAEGATYEYQNGRWRLLDQGASIDYVLLDASTEQVITGPIKFTNPSLYIENDFPYLFFNETDQPAGESIAAIGMLKGQITATMRDADGDVTQLVATISKDNTYVNEYTVITGEIGDARYAQLTSENIFTNRQYLRTNVIVGTDTEPAWSPSTPPRLMVLWDPDASPPPYSIPADVELLVQRSDGVGIGLLSDNNAIANIYMGNEVRMDAFGMRYYHSSDTFARLINGAQIFTQTQGTARFYSQFSGSGTTVFGISSNYPGTSGPGGEKMQVLGSGTVVNETNNYGQISDASLKENVVDLGPQLADMMKLRPVNFNFIADASKKKQMGLVAQEVQQVKPGWVEQLDDGNLMVKYSLLNVSLLKALQELVARVEQLESA